MWPPISVLRETGHALQQVIVNLVANAINYTPEAGEVEVSVSRRGDVSRFLEVSDNGGWHIGPGPSPMFFERFYRADKARSRNSGGAGLGIGNRESCLRRARRRDKSLQSRRPGKPFHSGNAALGNFLSSPNMHFYLSTRLA